MPGTIEWFRRLHSFSLPSTVLFLPSDPDYVTPCFSVLPGIAFSLDLIETTGKYGVAEVLLASAMAAGVFSIFGGQPLCIAGVTGTSLDVGELKSLMLCSSFRHRSYYRTEQDNFQHSGQDFESSGLPAIYGVGIPLGCDIPLDISPSKLCVEKLIASKVIPLTSHSNSRV